MRGIIPTKKLPSIAPTDSESDVNEVAVVGGPDDTWSQRVKAVVVPVADATDLEAEDVVSHAEERIASHKTPREIEFRSELPRNPTGRRPNRNSRSRRWSNRHDEIHMKSKRCPATRRFWISSDPSVMRYRRWWR